MKVKIQLSHFQQSTGGYCLPACVQMVLAYCGLQRSEVAIRRILGTRAFGTPSFANDADIQAVVDVMRSGQLALAPQTREFERLPGSGFLILKSGWNIMRYEVNKKFSWR